MSLAEAPAVAPPLRRRGVRRCALLRQAATELFLAHGYDGVSIDDIIARAGGSKSGVYRHFGGKEGLFVAVVEDLCDRITERLDAVDLNGVDLEEGLRRLGRALLEALLCPQHVALYRLVLGQAGRFPSIGEAWVRHGPDATRAVLAQWFRRHDRRLAGITPAEAAGLFHDLLGWDRLNRTAVGVAGDTNAAALDQQVETVLALFAHGFLRP